MSAITLANVHEALQEVDAWVDAYPAETVLALWEARAWEMLEYPSWEALCDSRGWTKRVALPRPERREVVATLRQEGMSTRAIAAATGVSHQTVANDLESGVKKLTPEPVRGTDGKTYAPTQPVRPTVVSDPEPVEVLTVEQWCERNGHEQIATDLSEDDLTPADLQFKRDFWRHMKVTHDLLMDMDFPHYFDADMSARLADFVQTIAAKHDRFAKSKNGLRVVQGGR